MAATSDGGGRRLTAITIDQAISSSSNFLITVLAARVLSADTFGLFGVVFLTYITTQGLARALVGEPLLVRPQESYDRPGEAIGTAALLGIAIGSVIAVAGGVAMLWDQDLGRGLLALAVCLPFLNLQDLGRYLGVATQRPSRAVALDVLWLVLQLGAVAALAVTGSETLTWFVIAWAGSGAVASGLLFWQHRDHWIILGWDWLRETWPFSWRYAMSFTSRQGSVLVASSFLAGILGARALGAVRGALVLFGPQVQLQAAAMAAGTAEVSRLDPESPDIPRHVRRTTLLTGVVALANLLFVLVIPDRVGELILGDTWEATQTLLLPAGLQMFSLALTSGARSALLGLRKVQITLRVDIAQTVATMGTTIVGALLWDVVGAYWAMAGGQAVLAVLWWAVYRLHGREADDAGSIVTDTV